jgi:hypothetical protein
VEYRSIISPTTPIQTLQENIKVTQLCDEFVGTGPEFVQRRGDGDEVSKDEDIFSLSQNVVGSTEKYDGYKYYEISLVCTYLVFNVFQILTLTRIV